MPVSMSANRSSIPLPMQRLALAGALPLPVWLYLLAVAVPIGFNVGPLALSTLRLLLLVMIVPLLIGLFSGRFGKILIIDVLFVLHILWVTLALAVNNPERVIENTGAAAIEFLGGYVLGRAYIRTPEAFGALCKALMLIVLFSAPFAVIETLTGHPLMLEAIRKLPGLTSYALNYQDPRFGLERVQFGFAHPIHYGLFASVAFSLVYVGLNGQIGHTRRVLSSALIGACGFLALSSGALLAIFLQLGLILWALVFNKVKARWWLLFGLFILAYIAIDLLSNRTPIKVFMTYATFSAHTAYWRSIIFDWGVANVIGSAEKGIVGSPLFGIGLKDWVRPWYMYSGSMDNFWLVIAVRYGIPGFLLLTLGYIIGVARIMRRNFENDKILTQFRLAWVFTFLGLSFTLSTVHIWTSIYSFAFFIFGAGMWLITVQVKERLSPDKSPDLQAVSTSQRPGLAFTRFPKSIKDGPHSRLGTPPRFSRRKTEDQILEKRHSELQETKIKIK